MIGLIDATTYYLNGKLVSENELKVSGTKSSGKKGTIAYSILSSHNLSSDDNKLNLRFDALASHDITYVGIIQSAKASGLKEFPVPYVLTNCHNSLCAVGGTINEDDHVFGLSCAKNTAGFTSLQMWRLYTAICARCLQVAENDIGFGLSHALRGNRDYGNRRGRS